MNEKHDKEKTPSKDKDILTRVKDILSRPASEVFKDEK